MYSVGINCYSIFLQVFTLWTKILWVLTTSGDPCVRSLLSPKADKTQYLHFSTRASRRRSAVTVAKNRVSTSSKSKSSSVAVSKPPLQSDMQSNPTGRGGSRRKRSSLTSSRTDPTKKTKAVGAENISTTGDILELPVDNTFKKTGDSAIVVHHSPQPSIEILDTDGDGGGSGLVIQNQAASTAMMGANSSMPPVSHSENKSGSSRLNYHLPLHTGS